jgi:hypothetical protein
MSIPHAFIEYEYLPVSSLIYTACFKIKMLHFLPGTAIEPEFETYASLVKKVSLFSISIVK